MGGGGIFVIHSQWAHFILTISGFLTAAHTLVTTQINKPVTTVVAGFVYLLVSLCILLH